MQDRFKFRIFEYETKEMVELDAVGYSSFDPFAEGKSRLIMIPSGLGNTFHYDKQCLYDNDKFSEPMQCTGLKDKNGKLIYEGDIVSIDDGELKGIAQRHDKFDEYYGCIEIKLICKHTTIYKPTVFAESEVIGNIYQNKELLEQ